MDANAGPCAELRHGADLATAVAEETRYFFFGLALAAAFAFGWAFGAFAFAGSAVAALPICSISCFGACAR